MPRSRPLTLALLGLIASVAGCSGSDGGGDPEDSGAGGDTAVTLDADPRDSSSGDTAGRDGGVDAPPTDGPVDTAIAEGATDVGTDATPAGCDVALPSWASGATFARDVHVKSGATGGDGTATKPFGKIQDAFPGTKPGDRIVVHAGTYTGDNFGTLKGTAAQPIAITGATGEATPIVSGGGEGIHLSSSTYVILRDLDVSGQSANGVNIDDSGDYVGKPTHHLLFQRVAIHDLTGTGNNDGLKLSGLDDSMIIDSRFAKIPGQMVDMVGCHRVTVARSSFRDSLLDASAVGLQMKGGSADNLVTRNVFVNAGYRSINAGGSTGIPFFRPIDAPHEAARLTISSNVFVGSEAAIGYTGCDACVVAHNTIIKPTKWVARILQESTDARFVPCRNGKFVDNIVVVATGISGETVNVGGGTSASTFVFDHNLWFHTSSATYKPTLPVTETASIYGKDPLLTDLVSPDAHLKSGSPATGAGIDVGAASPGDYDGKCWATPPSIGAVGP